MRTKHTKNRSPKQEGSCETVEKVLQFAFLTFGRQTDTKQPYRRGRR